MKVSEALQTRMTCRAYLDTPVPEATVRAILAGASGAPSGGNLQPWRVWVLTGNELSRLKAVVAEKFAAGQLADGWPEYSIYPPDMKEPYLSRKFKAGAAMYAAIGVERDDAPERMQELARNFTFFDAPVAMFFAIDRSMQQGQWADLGMFMQSVMLLAREHGLHTSALESWSFWFKTVAEFVRMPEELMLFCGMALGFMDRIHPINRLRTERAPVDEFAALQGF